MEISTDVMPPLRLSRRHCNVSPSLAPLPSLPSGTPIPASPPPASLSSNYGKRSLRERDYRTPWKSITLYQFFLKGFATADDSSETSRGIPSPPCSPSALERSGFYSRSRASSRVLSARIPLYALALDPCEKRRCIPAATPVTRSRHSALCDAISRFLSA